MSNEKKLAHNNDHLQEIVDNLNRLIIQEREDKEQKVREYEERIAKMNEKYVQELSRLNKQLNFKANLAEITSLIQIGFDVLKKANELMIQSSKTNTPEVSYFSGKTSECVDSWLAEVEKAFENYEEKVKIELAARHLIDQARQTFDGMKRDDLKWDEFKKTMKLKHRPANFQAKLRSRLDNLKQTGNFEQYVNDFRSLIADVENMSEIDKVYRFLSGLDEEMKKKLESVSFVSLDEAIKSASEIKLTVPASVSSSPTSNVAVQKTKKGIRDSIDLNYRRIMPEGKKHHHLLSKKDSYEKTEGSENGFQTRKKKSIKCFSCNGFGHVANNCNKMRKNSQ